MIERIKGLGGKRISLIVGVIVVLVIAVIGLRIYDFFLTDEPLLHEDVLEHFKYGSIGSEAGSGVPYWLFIVIPEVFEDLLPGVPGEGYERVGFTYEENAPQGRPIGTSYRDMPIPMVGLNCAICHTGSVRESAEGPARVVLGMPANQLYAQRYQRFLMEVGKDDDFNADTLIDAIQRVNPDFSWTERLLYRYIVIPRTKKALLQLAEDFAWEDQRPDWGPGRVDTFNPYKFVRFGLPDDGSVGTADFPSLWNQRVREGMDLHWDGNNDSLFERNISAAMGAGATEDSLDFPAMKRVADWALDVQPPRFPQERIDFSLVEAGREVYQQHCAVCHALDGALVGQVVSLEDIGTDPERLRSTTPVAVERQNTLGAGKPWALHRFKKTDGYSNSPLDGAWLRAPYLHNGSVPTMRDLLKPPEERPKEFYRGYNVYDYENMGFVSSGAEAERLGFLFETSKPGNGNQGHAYGTDLSESEIKALIEYLKTE